MATKVFTGALIDFSSAGGALGTNWNTVVQPAWTLTDDVNGSSGPVANTQLGLVFIVIGSPVDDATVPAVITMTAVRFEWDYTVASDADLVMTDAVTEVTISAPGGSGHYDATENPASFFLGTTRADLFTPDTLPWGLVVPLPGPTTTQSVTVSNYTVTVTYTTPSSVTSIHPVSGSVNGGQAFTIRGTGLSAVTAVTFGGAAATSIVAADTTVTGLTPEHASGAVTVTVTGVGDVPGGYLYIIPPTFALDELPGRTPIQQGSGR